MEWLKNKYLNLSLSSFLYFNTNPRSYSSSFNSFYIYLDLIYYILIFHYLIISELTSNPNLLPANSRSNQTGSFKT